MRFIFYFYYFIDSVKSINCTVWTLVRLFVRPRGQCGGTLSYSLSVNKKDELLRLRETVAQYPVPGPCHRPVTDLELFFRVREEMDGIDGTREDTQ